MSRAADSPTSRIRRVLANGCATIRRANDHYVLVDGRVGGNNQCGVVWLNASKAYYGHRIMYHGWVKDVLKHSLHNGGEFENEQNRTVWPSRYEDVSFEHAEVGIR